MELTRDKTRWMEKRRSRDVSETTWRVRVNMEGQSQQRQEETEGEKHRDEEMEEGQDCQDEVERESDRHDNIQIQDSEREKTVPESSKVTFGQTGPPGMKVKTK